MALKEGKKKLPPADKPAYLVHPVPNASIVKLQLRELGYQILDEQFAPEGYKLPAEVQKIVDDNTPDDPEVDANGNTVEGPINPITGLSVQHDIDQHNGNLEQVSPQQPLNTNGAATTPATGETPAQPAASQAAPPAPAVHATPEQDAAAAKLNNEAAVKAANEKRAAEGLPPIETLEEDEKDRAARAAAASSSTSKKAEDMTDAELREAIEKKSGSKPAWNAKRDTLIAQLEEVSKKK